MVTCYRPMHYRPTHYRPTRLQGHESRRMGIRCGVIRL